MKVFSPCNTELIEALDELAAVLESLRHPKHAIALEPLRARLARLLIRRWRRQKRELLNHLESFLTTTARRYMAVEADSDLRQKLQHSVTTKINATGVYDGTTSDREVTAFDRIVTDTMMAAQTQMELDYLVTLTKEQGQASVTGYLTEHGFSQLAADVDATSRERIANALVDTFESGGTYADAVRAIKDTSDGFSEARAETIARTELNAAYNSSMLDSGREIPGARKEWSPDGECCAEICQPNVDQGPILMDAEFLSGDDAPPGHVNCDCSLGIVLP